MNNQDHIRESIQAYLLGTLSDEEHAQVEASIAQDPLWQAMLEEETKALVLMDSLEAEEPPVGLAERTLAHLDGLDESSIQSRGPWRWKLSAAMALMLVGVFILNQIVPPVREHQRNLDTANYLKQVGLVFKMYSNESIGEKFPPLTPYEEFWMFDIEELHPEYLSDLTILVSPHLEDYDALYDEMVQLQKSEEKDWHRITEIASRGFSYTGWTFTTEDGLNTLLANRSLMASADTTILKSDESNKLRPIREGVERFLITDINNAAGSAQAQSTVPVFFETLESLQGRSHKPGANILYMDGHVEFHDLNKSFLSTPSTLERVNTED